MNTTLCHQRQIIRIPPIKSLLFTISLFFIMFFLLPLTFPITGSQASMVRNFYYFYPDSTQSNLSQLKNEVDSFFKRSSFPVHFQPFSHVKDFNEQIINNNPDFIFMPEWYYQKNKSSLKLKPLLRPQRKGLDSYTKVLISRKQNAVSINQLSNRTLAMTSEGGAESNILNTMLVGHENSSSKDINLIYTAKDADALFAVALGQVDVALVAKTTLDSLAKINKRLTQNLIILSESAPIALPILCYTEGSVNTSEIKQIRKLLLNSRGIDHQAKLKQMFQIDGWTDVK